MKDELVPGIISVLIAVIFLGVAVAVAHLCDVGVPQSDRIEQKIDKLLERHCDCEAE